MPTKRRRDKRRARLDDDEIAWLNGRDGGFVRFQAREVLECLWNEYGDEEQFHWDGTIDLPVRRC